MKKFGFTEIVIINTFVFAATAGTIILSVTTMSMMHDIIKGKEQILSNYNQNENAIQITPQYVLYESKSLVEAIFYSSIFYLCIFILSIVSLIINVITIYNQRKIIHNFNKNNLSR